MFPILHLLGRDTVGLELNLKLMALSDGIMMSEVAVNATGTGDVDTLRAFLQMSPDKVDEIQSFFVMYHVVFFPGFDCCRLIYCRFF